MQAVHFCPQCQEERPTFEFYGEGTILIRCQVCGYPVAEPSPEEVLAPIAAAGPTVLCIDDDPALLRVLADMLTRAGFTPITAPDGAAGLALAKRERPAAVLLDIMMPDLDGYEVCRQLRATRGLERLAIIMLTASADPKLNTNAFKAGADLAIRKPFDSQKLVATLRTALELKAIRRVL